MSILADQALATQIKEGRLAMGLSQAELAQELGVSQAAVAQWERGAAKPRGRHILAMSKYFGKPLGVTEAPADLSHHWRGIDRDLVKAVDLAKHGRDRESEDFEDELFALLQQRIPGLRRRGLRRDASGTEWLLDIFSDRITIVFKHPVTLQAASGGIGIRAALFDAAARRTQFPGDHREVVIVRPPPIPEGTEAFALNVLKHILTLTAAQAAALGVELLVASTPAEAALLILKREEDEEE